MIVFCDDRLEMIEITFKSCFAEVLIIGNNNIAYPNLWRLYPLQHGTLLAFNLRTRVQAIRENLI